jgi:hypothetical protein
MERIRSRGSKLWGMPLQRFLREQEVEVMVQKEWVEASVQLTRISSMLSALRCTKEERKEEGSLRGGTGA